MDKKTATQVVAMLAAVSLVVAFTATVATSPVSAAMIQVSQFPIVPLIIFGAIAAIVAFLIAAIFAHGDTNQQIDLGAGDNDIAID